MTAGCTISSLESRDLERIMPVMSRAFDPGFGEAWSIAQCRGLISLPGTLLLAALLDKEICGFALIRTVVDEAELMLLAVDPECQAQGVGRALVSHLVTECSTLGVKQIHLEVRENNPAFRFYTKNGFNTAGYRPNYYKSASGETFNAVTLTRNLG
jgi:[ribosomal protein S18]-alanine N-acetyltransferase